MGRISWLVVVAICVLVACGLGYLKYAQIQGAIAAAAAFPEPVVTVQAHTVQSELRTASMSVSGEVIAPVAASLTAELEGRVARVGFAPGSIVQKGQVLVQLDVAQEQAQVAEARAEQKIAQLALERAQKLVRTGAGSVEVRDQAEARFAAAGARVDALTAIIDKKTIRAPFDGTAGLHELEVGQFLSNGSSITQLVGASDNLWIDFSLPQGIALATGSTVRVQASSDQTLFPATVVARDATVSARSRNLTLRAEIDRTGEHKLLPGMLVSVVVPLGEPRYLPVVPATSIRRDALGAAVYVLENVAEDGQDRIRARKQPVQLELVPDPEQSSDMVVVLQGLSGGERIAAVGAFKLRDGRLVNPQDPDPAVADRLVGH